MVKKGTLRRFLSFFGLLVIAAAIGTSSSWAATILVTNTADSGAGSLRAAIAAANTDGTPTAILFDTSVLACPITISVGSTTGLPLPALVGVGDTIDGSACGVTLDGSSLGGTNDGLRVRASNITIRGLTIQNFPQDGIRVEPPLPITTSQTVTGVVISKNVIRENGADGLSVRGQLGITAGAASNTVSATIVNNELTRNADDGIVVLGSLTSTVGHTVEVVISHNLIRGSRGVGTGGTITGDGIRVLGSTAGENNTVTAIISNNRVENNGDDGILVAGAGNGPGSKNKVFAEIFNNLVRRNGNPTAIIGVGIGVRGGRIVAAGGTAGSSTDNEVTFFVGNNKVQSSKDRGINIFGGEGDFHTVKGTISDNDVSGSGGVGIRFFGGPGTDNTLVDITIKGNKSEGNGTDGIALLRGDSSNTVKVTGITDNEANNNGQDGIFVASGVPGSGATPISANTTNNNGQDGIDIEGADYVLVANTANGNAIDKINADPPPPGLGGGTNVDGGGNNATGNTFCNTPGCF